MELVFFNFRRYKPVLRKNRVNLVTIFAIYCLLVYSTAGFGQTMDNQQLWETFINIHLSPAQRIDAADQLAKNLNKSVIKSFHQYLDSPLPQIESENVDYAAQERFCRIALIEILFRLDDTQRKANILQYISNATGSPGTPWREVEIAARVILLMTDAELLRQLITLTETDSIDILNNVITTLHYLKLGNAPSNSNFRVTFPEFFSFEINVNVLKLKDYINDVLESTQGKIQLSTAAQAWLEVPENNFQCGTGDKDEVLINEFLETELELYRFSYLVNDTNIVILTLQETAILWQQWWTETGETEELRLLVAKNYLEARRTQLP